MLLTSSISGSKDSGRLRNTFCCMKGLKARPANCSCRLEYGRTAFATRYGYSPEGFGIKIMAFGRKSRKPTGTILFFPRSSRKRCRKMCMAFLLPKIHTKSCLFPGRFVDLSLRFYRSLKRSFTVAWLDHVWSPRYGPTLMIVFSITSRASPRKRKDHHSQSDHENLH
jgi:hypothetical protein